VAPLQTDGPQTGTFAFYLACAPEKWQRALSGIRNEITCVRETEMQAQELSRAKRYWLGRFELDMQRFSSQSIMLGVDEMYGLGPDHSEKIPQLIQSVTAADIRRVACKYLAPDRATISVVHGNALQESLVSSVWTTPSLIATAAKKKKGLPLRASLS
jgi:zinc protease